MNPNTCAKMHADKHVVKMILETCQMLCAVWHVLDPEHIVYTPRYKLTHKNHPCTIWTRESLDNYFWLCQLGLELCVEYTFRYGKQHACEPILEELSLIIPDLPQKGFTIPAQAMPDIYKDDCAVTAYRHYYFFEKQHIHSWTSRDFPNWLQEMYNLFE